MKKIYFSKTFMWACLQAVAGLLALLMSQNPQLETVGIIAMAKSVIDILLRFQTTEKVVL